MQIPIIDLSMESEADLAQAVKAACQDIGFFYGKLHRTYNIQQDLLLRQHTHSDHAVNWFQIGLDLPNRLLRNNHQNYHM